MNDFNFSHSFYLKYKNYWLILVIFIWINPTCTYAQNCLPDGIVFSTQQEVDDFATNYPGCVQILGSLSIIDPLSGSDFITNINGLSQLTSINGTFYGELNTSLSTLNGLENLTSIGGDLSIEEMAALTNLSGLDNLISINGDLEIEYNNALVSLNGLNKLIAIDGEMIINDNPGLVTLSGLDNLTSVAGEISIHCNIGLITLNGLDNLTSIGEHLFVEDNPNLTNLDNLINLTSISGELWVQDNSSLTSLSGLDNINPEGISDLLIKNNMLLSFCEVQSICDYLSTPSNTATISENVTGCNTRAEIEAACTTVSVSLVDSTSIQYSIYPNPTSGVIEIIGVEKGKIKISDCLGRVIREQSFSNQNIDISELPNGLYNISIHSSNQMFTTQIVKH